MALSSRDRVRSKISDRPQLRRERFTADGESDHFKLVLSPVQASPAPEVWLDGTLQVENTDYTVNYEYGIILFAAAPAVNQLLIVQYYASVWTDEEIDDYLLQYSDNVNIASAHLLLAWSADAAKLAKRETLSGGGGVGAVTTDTSVAARELRNTANALLEWETEYGTDIGTAVPAEGITQIPWTESAARDIEYQRFLRDSD